MTWSRPRLPMVALWLFSALLFGAGLYASTPRGRQRPASAQDTAVARTAASTPAKAPAAPPESTAVEGGQLGSGAGATAPKTLPTAAESARAAPSAAERVRQARQSVATPFWERLVSVLGLFVMLLLGWLMSADRRIVQWRVLIFGTLLQVVFAIFILKTAVGALIFSQLNDVIVALLGFTQDGARFLFGNLVYNNVPVGSGVPGGNGVMTPTANMVANTGATFAFSVLPTIIFFSSLMTVLYYFGVMQGVVRGFAWVMQRSMKTSGAETLSAAGNIFLGQTEAPLMIKPFVATMTNSELMAVMTGGFATVAGGVMAAYVGMLHETFPDIAGHLMAASVMSAPAALVFAKLMFPEKEEPLTRGELKIAVEKPDANVIDAAARGAGEGLGLALNVGAMLLAFIALIAIVNSLLGLFGDITHLTTLLASHGWLAPGQRLGLEVILGWVLAPLAWIMGVPWKDATTVGSLLGIKTALNEFVGYLQLANLLQSGANLSPRSVIIATYALCGFANFSSIAIQIGGIGGMAPNRRHDLAKLGMRAMIAGTLASFMTAAIAGILV